MSLKKTDAQDLARDLIMALAQSGSLKLAGSVTTKSKDIVESVGSRDAAYLATLYRDLVASLQS